MRSKRRDPSASQNIHGDYLVVAHGTFADAAKARNTLGTLKPTHVTDHVLEAAMQAVALEGWTPAMGSDYSVNFHAWFLEGWTGAIPSGYSVIRE
jgi:hypothetical protein